MLDMFTGLSFLMGSALFLALAFVLTYEFINGFHDTANTVATVIYTKAMSPHLAVVASGMFNFWGYFRWARRGLCHCAFVAGGYAAEYYLRTRHGIGIFPLGRRHYLEFRLSWYFGIPASSSHTLIGSLLGVCLANALLADIPISEGVNTKKRWILCCRCLFRLWWGFQLQACCWCC